MKSMNSLLIAPQHIFIFFPFSIGRPMDWSIEALHAFAYHMFKSTTQARNIAQIQFHPEPVDLCIGDVCVLSNH